MWFYLPIYICSDFPLVIVYSSSSCHLFFLPIVLKAKIIMLIFSSQLKSFHETGSVSFPNYPYNRVVSRTGNASCWFKLNGHMADEITF